MNTLVEAGVTIGLAVIGLAMVSVIVSRNAQTPQVVQSLTGGLAQNIGVAVSPVTGGAGGMSLGFPQSNTLGFGFAS